MSLAVLQFGTTGQLGIELIRQAPRHPELAITALSRAEADLTDPVACATEVLKRRPDLVVIAAAYTAVDQAESDLETAFRVNAEAPGAIAQACAQVGAALITYSTDYVFPGDRPGAYTEDDEVGPTNTYGSSKLAGERLVQEGCRRAVVVRTSWVVSAHGKNFIKTMLRIGAGGQPLRVVEDQHGRPTAASDLADFTLSQAARIAGTPAGDPLFGVVHFANTGQTSWRRFAEAILAEAMGANAPPVQPITTAEFPTPARRPAHGVLSTDRLTRVFGVTPRPWQAPLREIVAELQTQGAPA